MSPLLSRRGTVSLRGVGLLEFASATNPLYYRSGDLEMVGIGEYKRLTASGAGRFETLASLWSEFIAVQPKEVRESLVAFGCGSFDPSGEATLIIPTTLLARNGRELTRIDFAEPGSADAPLPETIGIGPKVEWPQIDSVYPKRVAAAIARLGGDFKKVVMARAITGRVVKAGDLRAPISRIGKTYPECHLFSIDGLWGASPEKLIAANNGRVSARVLAGSAARGIDANADRFAEQQLLTSQKDLEEHRFAVESVLSALKKSCRSLVSVKAPFTLGLANLWHLASDIEGVIKSEANLLGVIDLIHPTAAVAGVPTDRALELIREIEAVPRGRFAGPVGWIDGAQNGEWAIALRCAEWRGEEIVAHAGAGILEGSKPDSELAETELKLMPVRAALQDN